MRKLLPPALLVVAACNTQPPQVLPPPFGPLGQTAAHLFFPTGLAATADGALLVANGNFNHAYDVGTVVGLRPDYVARFFRTDTSNPDKPPLRGDNPLEGTESAVMIGNYAGPLTLDAAGA